MGNLSCVLSGVALAEPEVRRTKRDWKSPFTTACPCWAVLLFMTAGALGQNAKPPPPVDLLKKAGWQFSSGGRRFGDAAPVVPARRSAKVVARSEFVVVIPRLFRHRRDLPYVSLTLKHDIPGGAEITLNGRKIAAASKDMTSNTISGISAKAVHPGKNRITLAYAVDNSRGAKPLDLDVPEVSLLGLLEHHLAFRTYPVLGAAGEKFLTLACCTNMAAKVTLTVTDSKGKQHRKSGAAGLVHRFRIDGLAGGWKQYTVQAKRGSYRIMLGGGAGQPGKGFRFVALGASCDAPEQWKRIADAVAGVGPRLVLHTGDFVTDGRNESQWEQQCFTPARNLLSGIPMYAVPGDQEHDPSFVFRMFQAPMPGGRGANWAQAIGPIMLIGIDAVADFSADGKDAAWLEKQLKAARAAKTKFIFLAGHYPPWSSSGGEQSARDARPARQAREVIMPLLKKHGAAAMIAGHDRCYERSEPPEGVTLITTGGAGAAGGAKGADAARRNPYSKAFHTGGHFCMFDISGDGEVCTMRAVSMAGKVLDTKSWRSFGRSAVIRRRVE